MRQVYETQGDRDREAEVAHEIEQVYGCKLKRNEQLHHFDFSASWSAGRISNVEIRCRPGMEWGKYSTVYLSALKFAHATQGMRQGQSFSFFVKPSDGGIYKWTAKPEHIRLLKNTWDGKNARTEEDPQWLVEVPIKLFRKIK